MLDADAQLKFASQLVGKVGLTDLCVVEMRFRRLWLEATIPNSIDLSMNYGSDSKVDNWQESGRFAALPKFLLVGTASRDNSQQSVFEIAVTFSISYELTSTEEVTEDHLTSFAVINGIFNAWPFWRESVQTALSRMNLPPLTVPLLTVPELIKRIKETQLAKQDGPCEEKDPPGNPES